MEFIEILLDGSRRQRDQHVEAVDDTLHPVDRRADLVCRVSAADT